MTEYPITEHLSLADLGVIADTYASASVFETYRADKAKNTRERQEVDLRHFATYLSGKGVPVGDFYNDPNAWNGVTWGLVTGFVKWMLQRGDAIGSVNVRLTTVRRYAELAFTAGALTERQYALIQTVHGYRGRSAVNVDEPRPVTRRGSRKIAAPSLSASDRRRLKREHADDDQGARDELLMCILLDHGLRVGEIVKLTVGNVSVETGYMTFYREKVHRTDTHRLTPDTHEALKNYKARGLMLESPDEPLMVKTLKSGSSDTNHVGRRGLTKRVRFLGQRILGLPNLACHDCRHSWATEFARDHSEFELQEAGGWASLAMPRRYVEYAKISHDGRKMD